jgi:hypothetical protein
VPGPGKIQILDRQTDVFEALLYNFDIAKHQLKPEHEEWLKHNAAGYLKRGGSLYIIGLASRTDTKDFNKQLSQRRLESAVSFLRKESPNNFKISFHLAMGEDAAELAGVRDGSEDEKWRGVLAAVWERPKPPPPPSPAPAIPSPPMVERRIYVTFIAEFSMKGGTGGDPKLATWGSDQLAEYVRKRNIQIQEMRAKRVATQVVRQIFLWPDTSGSVDLGISKVDVLRCHIDYEWGKRRLPHCILVNRFDNRAAFQNRDPVISLLTEAQTAQFLNDPLGALEDLSDWEMPYVKYSDYLAGKY